MKLTWSETNMYSISEEIKGAEEGIIEEQSSKCWIQNDERRSKIGSVYTPCCWAKPPFKLPTPPSPYYQLSLLHENLNHKSPHYKPIEFSTRLRERDHSGIRTQDKLLFHFNIFFEFLWMETMTRLMRRGCGTIGLELKVWLWEVPNLDLICLFDTLLQSRENLWKQFPIV